MARSKEPSPRWVSKKNASDNAKADATPAPRPLKIVKKDPPPEKPSK